MSRLVALRLLRLTEASKFVVGRCSYSSSKESEKWVKTETKTSPDTGEDPSATSVKYILLLNEHKKLLGRMTVDQAQLLAKRRSLSLVRVEEESPRSQKMETFQLSETKKSPTKAKSKFQEDKVLNIKSKIGDHDLETRLASLRKWAKKNLVTKVTVEMIQAQDEVERILTAVEKVGKEEQFRITQKQTMDEGKTVKFLFQPEKKKDPKKASEQAQTSPPDKNKPES